MTTVGQQQQQQVRPQSQAVTQLEFHQAMRDFKTMFPEMDEDVIEVILRANNGAVDATIDQLLAMSTDNENERLRTELDATENAEVPPRYSPATPPPSYHQAVPYAQSPAHSPAASAGHSSPGVTCSSPALIRRSQQMQSQSPYSQSPATPPLRASTQTTPKMEAASHQPDRPLRTVKNWQPPLLGALPDSFLKLDESALPARPLQRRLENVTVLSSAMLQQRMEENERQRRLGGTEDPELTQYLEDERIAIFLQNEEFMQELRRNKEFMSTLDRASPDLSSQEDGEEEGQDGVPEEMDSFPYTRPIPHPEDSDAAFREKLKNMGKLSRRKFAQLARLFSRRRKPNFRQILGEGSNPSRDNLLLHEDDYSELSEEDSEADQNKEDTWNSHEVKEASPGHQTSPGRK